MMVNQSHPFHMVTYSPWPIITSMAMMLTLIKTSMLMWNNASSLILPLMTLMLSLMQWFRDMIRESTLQGMHTKSVMKGMQMGMVLFILSEVLLFSSLFWMLLHSSLSPSQMIGSTWPPLGITVFNPLGMPMLNTALLLTSGFFITWSHFSLLNNNYLNSIKALGATITLGLIFLMIQLTEYKSSAFTISDSIYSSAFFMITGFHGSHVLLGCILLSYALYRMNKMNFSPIHHMNFELASWYWHFVDIIWILVYMLLYF